jgi:hypothetical protein
MTTPTGTITVCDTDRAAGAFASFEQCHAASLMPPVRSRAVGHADTAFGVTHSDTRTHQIEELPSHRSRKHHCNPPNRWMLQ